MTASMNPEQTIKYMILAVDARWSKEDLPGDLTGEQVDQKYDELVAQSAHWDARSEVRCGGVETDLPCEYSRHYESRSVAAKAPNGQWVGWTYWYGGGKHGEPEAIDWMEDAYFLDCIEEQKVVTVRTFTKP
ncbi:hypothetical protein [Pseudomonas sp.]|uniref:hypothetical protein n=1 Tax=Pseudomonas sp. TaxID=306 RepID=UPI0025839F36|nr:hypothetical protein [Pseudomonas sp.]